MPTKPLWASDEELLRWKASAEIQGLTFNAWLRRAANDRADLEAALERERKRMEGQ